MSYLRSFIIGASFPVFILFFLSVRNIPDLIKNYTYEDYTIIAPVYLGLMNALSLYLATYFGLSLRMRYVLIGIISPLIVITVARSIRSYNYNRTEWNSYYLQLVIKHFLIFNIIVYNLEKNI